jgi:hypothetical protein
MELHSYETYIDSVIEKFDANDFSPENARDIPGLLKAKIGIDSPYWQEVKTESASGGTFYVKFKKYGENRKEVLLRISFKPPLDEDSPRELILTLVNGNLNELEKKNEPISLSDIWKDHSVLSIDLKQYVKRGLELAGEVNT